MQKHGYLILAIVVPITFLVLASLAMAGLFEVVVVVASLAALASIGVGVLVVLSHKASARATRTCMLELEDALAKEKLERAALQASFARLAHCLSTSSGLVPVEVSSVLATLETHPDAVSISKVLAAIEALPQADPGGRRAGYSLLTEARLHLPFAEKISASVPGKTEEATFVLIEKFSAVQNKSSRAAEAARVARSFLDGSSNTIAVNATASRTRESINSERLAINGMVQQNRENKKNLNAMSKELEAGIELLHGIEEITERSKLIAFNMAIEAARIGEKGRGFRVIVGELHLLNERTADFSRRVSKLLGRFKEYTTILVTEMAERSEELLNNVELGMIVAEESVETLIEASAATEKFTREISALAVEIDKDLDGVLESLQFQDITRQMIESAVTIIGEANRLLMEAENKIGKSDMPDRATQSGTFEALRHKMLNRSKTSGEKQAIAEAHL